MPDNSTVGRRFKFAERKTDRRIEGRAGGVDFAVTCYIIFLNAAILTVVGGPAAAAIATATCVVAAVSSCLMGWFANWPMVLAPGLGINAVVAFQLIGAKHLSFAEAMTLIILEGALAMVLVIMGLREKIVEAVPLELRVAIGIGIGLFIGFIGLNDSGIIAKVPGVGSPPVGLASFTTWQVAVALGTLLLMIYLTAREVKGALLIGIVAGTVAAMVINRLTGYDAFGHKTATWPGFSHLFSWGSWGSIGHVSFGAFSKLGVIQTCVWIFVLFMGDFFDTLGTGAAVGKLAGLVNKDGQLYNIRQMLFWDSFAAFLGGWLGTSSATSFVESGAGAAEGGRTGYTAIVAGLCFLPFIFVTNLVNLVPLQATGPALVIVAYHMVKNLVDEQELVEGEHVGRRLSLVDFHNVRLGLPAVLMAIMMPFSYSITNGIGFGFITFCVATTAANRKARYRRHHVHPLMWVCSAAFLLYFAQPLLEKYAF